MRRIPMCTILAVLGFSFASPALGSAAAPDPGPGLGALAGAPPDDSTAAVAVAEEIDQRLQRVAPFLGDRFAGAWIDQSNAEQAIASDLRHPLCQPLGRKFFALVLLAPEILGCSVVDPVIGNSVHPAPPDDPDPGASEDPDGMWVIGPARPSPPIHLGSPRASMA